MEQDGLKIEWSQKSGKKFLRFVFGETLTIKEAEIAIKEWKEIFKHQVNESIVLIWDCRKMKGYDSDARTKWTGALKEMKSQIDMIWLITESTIIRMGASVMGMLSTINIKPIRSESEIII